MFLPWIKAVWCLEMRFGKTVLRRSARILVMILGMDERTLMGRKSSRQLDPCFFGIREM
jgi:hypothetical protein